jgi:hypothetical protein
MVKKRFEILGSEEITPVSGARRALSVSGTGWQQILPRKLRPKDRMKDFRTFEDLELRKKNVLAFQ